MGHLLRKIIWSRTFVQLIHLALNLDKPYSIRLTNGPSQHWFGYYDICPWSGDNKYLLSMEHSYRTTNNSQGADAATIGIIDVKTNTFTPLYDTLAWNWQQGALAQWLPSDPNRKIIFNEYDLKSNRLISCILDIKTGVKTFLPMPISAVSNDGKYALSINFNRFNHSLAQNDYAYTVHSTDTYDTYEESLHPSDDGIFRVDLDNGDIDLIVSMEEILAIHPQMTIESNRKMFLNHTLFNPDGSRFCFFARSHTNNVSEDPLGWHGHIFSASITGEKLRCIVPFHPVYKEASHYSWINSAELCVYHRGFYGIVRDDDNSTMNIFLTGVTNGHPSISPTFRNIFVSDTYPLGRFRSSTLWLYNIKSSKRIILGKFFSPPEFEGNYRCDLHPRWNRNGTMVCFDSTHEGLGRQIYILDVRKAIEEIQ